MYRILLATFVVSGWLASGLADTPGGQVVGWGYNISGEATGQSSYTFSNNFVVIGGNPFSTGTVRIAGQILDNAVAVSAGDNFGLALKSDGSVAGWGSNMRGRAIGIETPFLDSTNGPVTVHGTILGSIVAIAKGITFGLALKSDGSVVTWGRNEVPAGLTNIIAIAARGFWSLALRSDGTVAGWCNEPWGNPIDLPAGLSNVMAVAVGGDHHPHFLALKRDGTVVNWGIQTIFHDLTPPAGLTNVIKISAGWNHSLALRRDGTVVGWGFNDGGQATGVPTEQHPKISAGPVQISGRMLTNVVAISAGNQYNLALKSDGSIVAWGNKRFYREVPAGLSNVIAVAAGDGFCLAITKN